MLTNAKEMLEKASEGKYAVGQYNINNLEWTKSILETIQETNSPAILGVSEGAAKYMGGFEAVVGMVRGLHDSLGITVPVAIHLDHGSSVENCKAAIDAGFTSVMFDGSELPIEENVSKIREVIEYASPRKVSVEGEVGTVGGEEDGVVGGISYAKEEDVIALDKAGVTMLAASLGSVHGHYQGEPQLQFELMEKYRSLIKAPLVLHGGSGIPNEMIQRAIRSGEAKININTEIQEAFTRGVVDYIEAGKYKNDKGYDPRKVLAGAIVNMKEEVKSKITLFGTTNKA